MVKHVVEDLTHYESGFWKTIKYLLFRPALLTKEYLAGKRMSYVVPIRLYLFVSFLCFFLPALLPDFSKERLDHSSVKHNTSTADTVIHANEQFRRNVSWSTFHMDGEEFTIPQPNDFTSVAQLDSMEQSLPQSKRYNWLEYKMAKRIIEIYNHYTPKEIGDKFQESFFHNLSKVLFVYMPLFAFSLWIFHRKKKWMYFDHAIFTLHNFSFLLLIITFFNILESVFSPISYLGWVSDVQSWTTIAGIVWIIYYAFRSHRKMYGESWVISTLKSITLFSINIVLVFFLLVVFFEITLFNMH